MYLCALRQSVFYIIWVIWTVWNQHSLALEFHELPVDLLCDARMRGISGMRLRVDLGASPLEADLWFRPLRDRPLRRQQISLLYQPALFLDSAISKKDLIEKIQHIPLDTIWANPGHAPLRSVTGLALNYQRILTQGYQPSSDLAQQPTFNLLVDQSNHRLQSIEMFGGHNRMINVIRIILEKNLKKTIHDLEIKDLIDFGMSDLRILINGRTLDGKTVARRLPAHGLDFSKATLWTSVNQLDQEGIPTLKTQNLDLTGFTKEIQSAIFNKKIVIRSDKGEKSGELLLKPSSTQYAYGSRETLETVFETMNQDYHPKIGYKKEIKAQDLKNLNLLSEWCRLEYDEVIIVSHDSALSSLDLERLVREANQKLSASKQRLRLNVWSGRSSSLSFEQYLELFGEESFRKRLQYIFRTVYSVDAL